MINLQQILYGLALGALVVAAVWLHHSGVVSGRAEIQAQWDAERAQLNQAAIAQAAAAKLKEKQQHGITQRLRTAYAQDTALLLDRIRELGLSGAETVPRPSTMCLADSQAGAMPGTPQSAIGTNATPATEARPRFSFTPAQALADTLQCTKLQEWVRAMGD